MIHKINNRKTIPSANRNFNQKRITVSRGMETVIQPKIYSQNFPVNAVISWLKGASLRTKATTFAIGIAVLPVLGVGTLTYSLATPSITTEIANHQQESAIQRKLLLILGMNCLVTALLVGAAVIIITNRLTLPILNVTKSVSKLAKGNLNTRIPIQGENELASLSANINRIVDQLQELQNKQIAETKQLQSFTNILNSISHSLNSDDLLTTTVTETRAALKAHRVVIYNFKSRNSLQVVAESRVAGLPRNVSENIENPDIIQELIAACQKNGMIAVNNIWEGNFSSEYLRLMQQLHIKATLIAPIIKDNEIFGFLMADYCWAPHIWQHFEVHFLSQLSVQLGLSLERLSLLENTQAIKELAINMSGSLKSQNICNLAVENVQKALKVERVLLCRFDANWQANIVAESAIENLDSTLGNQLQEPWVQDYVEQFHQGSILISQTIEQVDTVESQICLQESFAVTTNLVAPIFLGEKFCGLLIAHDISKPRVWQQSEIDLLDQLARHVGLALERANVLELSETAGLQAEIKTQQQLQQNLQLQQQLQTLLNSVTELARGNLNIRAKVNDGEVGQVAQVFNAIADNLQEIVTQVQLADRQMHGAIAENSGAIGQLAIAALKQSQEISRTLDAVEQMRLSMKEIVQNSKQVATVACAASCDADSNYTAITATGENILSVGETFEGAADKIKLLGESSQEISPMVSLINQIAMEINLLAIRGGENVTQEVAALTTRTAAATAKIESILTNIQQHIKELLQAMEVGNTKVVESTHLVETTKLSLNHLFDLCRQIDLLVHSISIASISEVETSQEVSNAMKEITKVSEMTSSSSRKFSASLQKTVEISQQIKASVRNFKIG
ncbi:MAG: GAF domain-containing protein [Nostocaceae cyanobacterium]|nr:GAF domain-containing protein [Nostocaceae cyanobacterium]